MTRKANISYRQGASPILAFCGLLTSALGSGPVSTEVANGDVLPLSLCAAPGIVSFAPKRDSAHPVSWRGIEYTREEVIPILSSALLDPEGESERRRAAAKSLEPIAVDLHGTPWITKLVGRYDSLEDLETKKAVLACLLKSEDPRAFPTFSRILQVDRDPVLRLYSAIGLAKWNVRVGVKELIELFASREKAGWIDVGVSARRKFTSLNRYRKLWGCPEDEIDARVRGVLQRSGEDAAVDELMRGFRAWFAENEHRFPEWKLGDPLPEVEARDGVKAPDPSDE